MAGRLSSKSRFGSNEELGISRGYTSEFRCRAQYEYEYTVVYVVHLIRYFGTQALQLFFCFSQM